MTTEREPGPGAPSEQRGWRQALVEAAEMLRACARGQAWEYRTGQFDGMASELEHLAARPSLQEPSAAFTELADIVHEMRDAIGESLSSLEDVLRGD